MGVINSHGLSCMTANKWRYINLMGKEKEHRCIISCEICLKEHREIINRSHRAQEFLKEVGDEDNEVAKILRGESH